MKRKSIPTNTIRQLWAGCGGHCQNPCCNRFLFASVGEDVVSLANVAHVIGHGVNGPRAEHELAEIIDRDGMENLIMLCLDCHKIVDELESQFSVEAMQEWKREHEQKVRQFFDTPHVSDEAKLLIEVSDLLDTNGAIFREYGPYSQKALEGDSGDALTVWRRRCFDAILPNNKRIINLIEKNRRKFPYPWDVYKAMLNYKLHVDAFEDNCLLGQKVNDYKLFPVDFDHFVKTKLGLEMHPFTFRENEELEFRKNQVDTFIENFLNNHSFITQMEKRNRASMLVTLRDGRSLRVFVTNTYYFTEYTFNKVMAVDPCVDVIICSCPYAQYTDDVKQQCIDQGVGLFMLGEFMGAVRKTGEDFLNYLLKAEVGERNDRFKVLLRDTSLSPGSSIYLFGSYLRRKLYHDIDVMVVYSEEPAQEDLDKVSEVLKTVAKQQSSILHLNICSREEFASFQLEHDNLTEIGAY